MTQGRKKTAEALLKDEQAKNALAWFLNEVHLFQRHRVLSPETVTRNVFFSYAWEDPVDKVSFQYLQDFLRTLKQHFDNAGVPNFLDLFSMAGHIEDRMSEGIDQSNLIIVMGTSTYAKKTKKSSNSNVKKELEYALEKIKGLRAEGQSSTCVLFPLLVEGQAGEVFHRLGIDCMIREASHWFNVATGHYQMQDYIRVLSAIEGPGLLPLAFRLDQPDYPDQAFKSAYINAQTVLMGKIQAIYGSAVEGPKMPNIRRISFEDLKFDKEEDKLGEGSFGAVYESQWHDMPVAVKEMSGALTERTAEYLASEADLMTRANGPYVVRAYGIALKRNKREQLVRAALVMELMTGSRLFPGAISLNQLLLNGKELPWAIRMRIARGVAQGLQLLHGDNILHRDLKSHNILLNDRLEPKLSDFGLAQTKDSSRSSSRTTSKAVGTRAWMAPELLVPGLLEIPYSEYSDIYALAVLFWEIAMRELPYKGRSEDDIKEEVVRRSARPAPLSPPSPIECPAPTFVTFSALIEGGWKQKPEERLGLSFMIEQLRLLNVQMAAPQALLALPTDPAPVVSSSSAPVVFSMPAPVTPLRAVAAVTSSIVVPNSAGLSVSGLREALPAATPARVIPSSPVVEPSNVVAFRSPSPPQARRLAVPQELSQFLRLVAEGEQEQAEAMLQKNRDLVLFPGNVTDLSKRSFENITAFQYAVWALDWHMWTMLRRYLPDDQAAAQLMSTGSWVRTHGLHAGVAGGPLDKLQGALQAYIKDRANNTWQKQVGGAQLLLPAHVINEYCRPDRSFDPCPAFTESTLPRTRKIDEREWFTATYNGGKLGGKFAVGRSAGATARGTSAWGWLPVCSTADYAAVASLTKVRTQQRDQLCSELSSDQQHTAQRRLGT